MKKLLNGNEAAAMGARLCKVQVIPNYPITPSFPVHHQLARDVMEGKLQAHFINMESDQSAMAAAVGASLCGLRAFTATNSQGLAYMSEHLFYASGLRLPIVMAVVSRALSSPHCRFADHGDALAQKTSGWMLFFCETHQEIVDTCIQLYKVCEDPRVQTPAMFCYEAYIQSHTFEPLDIPAEEAVDAYLGERRALGNVLDPDHPISINPATPPALYIDFKHQQWKAMEESLKVIEEVRQSFQRAFGRDHGGAIDTYQMEDAEVAIATMGSLARTSRRAILELREEGVRAGLVRLRSFRPFPAGQLRGCLRSAGRVVVLDKNSSPGAGGAVYDELRGALYDGNWQPKGSPKVFGFIAGLGGRDVTVEDVKRSVKASVPGKEGLHWMGFSDD